MTEDDFSPEFQEKQRLIHRWVSETEKHSPCNPFVPGLPQQAQTFNVVRPPLERRVSSSSLDPTTSSHPKSRTNAYTSYSHSLEDRHRQQPLRTSTPYLYVPPGNSIYQQQTMPNYDYMHPQRGQMTTVPLQQPTTTEPTTVARRLSTTSQRSVSSSSEPRSQEVWSTPSILWTAPSAQISDLHPPATWRQRTDEARRMPPALMRTEREAKEDNQLEEEETDETRRIEVKKDHAALSAREDPPKRRERGLKTGKSKRFKRTKGGHVEREKKHVRAGGEEIRPDHSMLQSWTQINFASNVRIHTQIQILLREAAYPWRSVDLISQSGATVVMDILQQELDDHQSCVDEYRTTCIKCLRALGQARNIVPSSFSCLSVTRDGGQFVGGGAFSDIYKGRLHGNEVCLKVLRILNPEVDREKECRKEALIWRQICHPNILPFLGVNEELFAHRPCLISPWMVNGNIMSFLETHLDHDRLKSLVEVAEAMKYLHNLHPPIIHADIRGANILVMNDLRCCLADFGLTIFTESRGFSNSSMVWKGALRWLAPEYIIPGTFDQSYIAARDSYAYGCTVIEILTQLPPFSDIKSEAAFIGEVTTKRSCPHLKLPPGDLGSLVAQCLRTSPSERPNARKISRTVRSLAKSPRPI